MLMKIQSQQKQKGIGLLELMLSLAIISVLLVMATRYYQSARQSQQVNDAISLTEAIVAGSENWVLGKDGFDGITISNLIADGYLPRGSDRDPWHGTTEVSKGDQDNRIKITLNGVPVTACNNLVQKLKRQSDDTAQCAGTSFTASF